MLSCSCLDRTCNRPDISYQTRFPPVPVPTPFLHAETLLHLIVLATVLPNSQSVIPTRRNPVDVARIGPPRFVGFPCQDVSRLNPASDQHRWVIQQGSKRTGSVFGHMVSYSSKLLKGPGSMPSDNPFRGLLMENVLGLTLAPKGTDELGNRFHSNLDYCCLQLKDAGFTTVPVILDPQVLGIPVSRQRVWLLVFPTWLLDGTGVSGHSLKIMVTELIDRLCIDPTQNMRDLKDFLLPANHHLVREEIQRAQELDLKRRVTAQKKATAKTKAGGSVASTWFVC